MAISIMSVSVACAQQDVSENAVSAREICNAGKDLLKEKKIDAAIGRFTEAIALYPTDSAYANLGWAYIRKGDDKNALFALNKAIDLNAGYAWALGLRGYLYTKIDAPELAFNDLSTAIALNTKGGAVPAGQSKKETIRDYTRAIDQNPQSDSAYVRRARAYEYYRKNKQAVRDYAKAITLNPDNADAFYGLQNLSGKFGGSGKKAVPAPDSTIADTTGQWAGKLFVTQGNTFSSVEELYELTVNDYTKVIGLYPDNAAAYRDRGYLYARLKKRGPAIADFSRAIELEPQSAGAWGGRGALYVGSNQPELAIADLNRAIELNPDATQDYYNRALAYYQKAAYEQAIADFTTVISKEPQHALAYRQRGNLYIYMNQPALAIVDLTKAIETGPRDAENYAVRGLAYAVNKDYKAAVRDLTDAIRLSPENATTYANRAMAYTHQKNYRAAIKDYTKAIQLDPQDAKAYRQRGELYRQTGKKQLATADFRKAATTERP
ncbi:tetratricopeptide repeat protein [Chitinophaga varians]|uniref:Tetratricopeptide repeat protein n=1 Tax=Chitinophaga varians TaxID=2202339 RepID=A0A847S217_9BACT|nr:tetratricopeptide repeat protein [Chitinophaga varians]NLR66907.1 tetratricopeptide repeat protein [Chitinophaga varians]